jgi:hypothetical protein
MKSRHLSTFPAPPRRLGGRSLPGWANAAILLVCASTLCLAAANWQSTMSKEPAGSFAELRPFHGTYRFGWAGLTAAMADVHFSKPAEGRLQLEGAGHTVGLARALWKFDVSHRGVTDESTLRPVENNQTETVRSKKVVTHLVFNGAGVTRERTENAEAAKTKNFRFPNLFDLDSALLYLRSQPLKDRSSYRVAVYPGNSAYVATITVLGHEKIAVHAGSYNAIKLDLQLSKIGKDFNLEPHRKFRRATIWVSDDADRIILRIEAQIFLGTVFAELQSAGFESGKP